MALAWREMAEAEASAPTRSTVRSELRGDTILPQVHGVDNERDSDVGREAPEDADAAFLQGYRDFGGRPEWERHFVDDVIPNCENYGRPDSGWYWDWSMGDVHLSAAQFHPNSWGRAAQLTGLSDPTNLYHVGANVAAWSNAISHPGGTGGWPYCWW